MGKIISGVLSCDRSSNTWYEQIKKSIEQDTDFNKLIYWCSWVPKQLSVGNKIYIAKEQFICIEGDYNNSEKCSVEDLFQHYTPEQLGLSPTQNLDDFIVLLNQTFGNENKKYTRDTEISYIIISNPKMRKPQVPVTKLGIKRCSTKIMYATEILP